MTSPLEAEMEAQIRMAGLPTPMREFRFAAPRRWRADFGWPDKYLLLEVDGGTWINGRHSRGAGVENDCEKYSAAAVMGYRVLRATSNMVKDGRALRFVQQALQGEKAE